MCVLISPPGNSEARSSLRTMVWEYLERYQKAGGSCYLWEEMGDKEQEWKRIFTLMCLDFFPHAYVSPILNKNLTIKTWHFDPKWIKKWAQCNWIMGFGSQDFFFFPTFFSCTSSMWKFLGQGSKLTCRIFLKKQHILDQDFNVANKVYL